MDKILNEHTAKRSKLAVAWLLAFLMLLGTVPVNVSAQTASTTDESGNTPFFYIDGERVPIDDERIINIVPVTAPPSDFANNARTMTALSGGMPNVSNIVAISGAFANDPNVQMGTTTVSAQRYAVEIDGVLYEAFCADPALPGPENSAAVYQLVGPAAMQYSTVLRYGFPVNPYLSEPPYATTNDDRMWNAYITRVAVAMANNPDRQFTGNEVAINQATALVNGSPDFVRDFDNTRPAIMVNGDRDAEDFGNLVSDTAPTAQSQAFNVTYHRRNHSQQNHFRFEWAAGTPAGAELVVNGSILATAPTNSNNVFYDDVSFQIRMPNTEAFHTQTAKVYLVGIHNAYANTVWLMQNPNNDTNWQDIVFYIPYMRASAAFEFEPTETPTPEPTPTPTPEPEPMQLSTAVQITKINELSTELIPGASVRLRGISNQTIVLPDGSSWQLDNTGIDVTVVMTAGHALPPLPQNADDDPVMNPVEHEVTDGVWTIHNLPFGAYIVYEVTPPENFSILPAQNHGGAYAFWLAPPNLSISIAEPEEGEDGENEPQIMIDWDDFRAMLLELANIDIGDEPDLGDILGIVAEVLENLELQVILPDHLTNPNFEIGYDPVASSIQVQFRNYPYGAIEVTKLSTATGQGLAGAHFTLQGYAVAPDRHSTQVITRTGVTGSDGTFLFENLPAGHFTVTEVQAPVGYMLGTTNDPHSVTQGVSVSWGDTAEIIFRNDPFGYLELTKIDGVDGTLLSGAVFEITGHSGTQQGTTSGGILRFEGLTPGHQYVVREISPPPGFVLMEGSRSITISPGTNTMVWENWRNPTLTIIKVDQDTEARLAGTHFTVTFEDGSIPNNLPELITDSNGEIVIDGALLDWDSQRTLIITEIVPPHGYHLGEENWQSVTLRAGYNQTVVFRNQRRPTITITKIDSVLRTPVPNAVFHIEKLDAPERGPLTGNPFRTDANGQIVLPIRHAGRYLIREIQAAPNYFLDPQQSNREWIIDVLPNEDYYLTIENTLLPTLVITKMNMVNMRPVPLTWFRIYYEVPFSNNVQFITEQRTNERGQIILPFVQVGWYRIIETRPAPGMSLNVNNSYRVFLEPGRNSYQLLQQGLLPRVFDFLLPESGYIPEGSLPDMGNHNVPSEDLDVPAGEVEQLPPQDNPLPDDIADMPMTGIEPTVSDITGSMQWSDGSNFRDGASEVWNWPLNSIIIRKICNRTGQLLPNATFDLIHISQGQTGTQGQVVGTFTTNHTGIIVITGLLPGSYAVEEVTAPPNFTLSGQTRQLAWLAPDNHSIVELTFANEPFGSLLVSLRCEVTGEPLQNAEFRVTNSAGAVVGTANGLHRTNQQGEFLIPNVPPDTYIVTQTLAPSGYTFGSVQLHQTILVPATGQTYRLEFTNQPYSALIIRKLDSFDSSPIPGTIFRVNRPNGELIGEFTTDQLGTIEITGLLGHFTITELHVPAGFERDTTTVRTTQVLPQAPSVVTFFSPRLGSLTIEAVDSFGTPVAGAGFRVSRQNGEFVGTYTTPASGIINIPTLTSGWYVVEPTTPPTGFITADTGRSVDVQPNSAPRTAFVYHRLSVLTIEAVDGDTGAALAGVQFEVRRPNGERISIGTTNNAGVFVVNGIDPTQGAVVIEPLSAPTGFVINEQARTVEFALGQNRAERFRAYRMGSMVIELTSESGNPLQGGRFRVTRPNGVVLGEFTTPVSGFITINNLESGTYIVEQIAPPTNWVMTDTGRTVEVHATQTTRVQFTNTQRPSLVIEKVDENGAPLAGAEFEVRTLAGALIQRVVTNNGGVATIAHLEPGILVIEETRSPLGFVITEGARTVEIIAGQTLVERFVNHRATTLTIEKVDENGSPLSGAEFEIRTLSGELLHRAVTNNGGIITIPNMQPQSVVIEETRAPQGFVLDGVARTVEISAGQNITERFINHRSPSLIIEKVDENGAPLQGAEFEIRTLAGALIQRVTTNSGGIATVTNLEPGVLLIEETRSPQGFVITEGARTVEFVAGQSITERFVNLRAATLTIEKVDGDGNPLANAEFEIRTPSGELLHRAVTNNGGIITIPDMQPQTVIIEETRPPVGFVIGELARTVELSAGQNRTERFVNFRSPSLIIEKVDENGAPLGGAEFEIRRFNGELVHRLVSNNAGLITIEHLEPGAFEIIETRPPAGHTIIEPSRAIEIVAGETRVERFVNPRLATFVIHKVDGVTNEPLQGVLFEITTLGGEHVRNPANNSFEFITDSSGMIRLPELPAGSYVATETRALPGYRLAEPLVFQVGHDNDYIITIRNYRYPDYTIRKLDGHTLEPLAGVQFEVAHLFGGVEERLRNPRDGSFIWTTDGAGLIRIPHLPHGTYVARELRPLPGFQIAEPVIFVVNDFEQTTLTIHNYRYSVWNILKLDGDTNEPLQGVVFEVARLYGTGHTGDRLRNPNTGTFEFVTGANGMVTIGSLEPNTYIITETRPLPGFIGAEPQIITVTNNTVDTTITFRNYRMGDINLLKLDGDTNTPLQGVIFEIHRQNGERVQNPANNTFEFTTDNAGRINMGFLAPGVYLAVEVRALEGFQLADPVPFEVIQGRDLTVTVRNYRMGEISLLKVDGGNNSPLQGVVFEIHRQNGERIQNPANNSFEFTTDNTGRINLGFLAPGSYLAVEVRALDGFVLADPTPFEVIQGRDLTVTVRNYRQAELTIRKVNSINRAPLEGVFFQIGRPDGTLLVNPQTGGHDFITDARGLIFLPAVEDGVLYVRETRALPGFLIDEEVTRVIVNAESRNREHLVTIENTPAAGLLIIAIDGTTNEPLQGIEMEIRHADGRLVTGQMLDGNQRDTHANSPQLSANGLFVTDARGRINLNHLEPGVYHVRVTSNIIGMQAEDNVHVVTVHPGEQAVLEIRLNPLAGLRLTAACAITGTGIFNVEFMVFDANNHNVGVFRTDNMGVIDFSHILNPGRYTIRLTSFPRGFGSDEIPRTVEFVAGRITEVVWELMPQAGQIQIQVVSGDDNFNNALPAGTPLEGAIFEVFEARTGNIVDRFISGNNGMAVSLPLPLGRYIIRQVQAPPFYQINPNEMHVEIEFETQIVRITYPNFSANMAVTIRVTGPQMVQQGQPVVYEIMQMMNESSVPIADFYWRATLPVEAVRAERLITGTYNQNLRYRVLGTTNTGREIVIADNLSTTRNNVVELAPVHLGLGANEYIVDFILHFGQVNAGFMSVENPRIFANVLPRAATILPPNMTFALLVDVGGRVVGSDEWVLGNNTTAAVLQGNNERIPQSGW